MISSVGLSIRLEYSRDCGVPSETTFREGNTQAERGASEISLGRWRPIYGGNTLQETPMRIEQAFQHHAAATKLCFDGLQEQRLLAPFPQPS